MANMKWDYSPKTVDPRYKSQIALMYNSKGELILGLSYGIKGYVINILNTNYPLLNLEDVSYYEACNDAKKSPTYDVTPQENRWLIQLKAACSIAEKRAIKEFDNIGIIVS